MRKLTIDETVCVSGGVPVANPNACSSAILGASGVGGAVGGLIGALAGPLGAAALGTLGATAAGGYAAANNPACQPAPAASGGSGGGCVQIDSMLPDGNIAGNIEVGSVMQLGDATTLAGEQGPVSFSKRKKAQGFRITTMSGATLVCSDTAPIPTPDGVILAPHLAGRSVAVRRDEGGSIQTNWDSVASIDPVGEIDIQHITVGNKCFWAGEKSGAYILHHNKMAEEGGDDFPREDWDMP